MAFLTFLAVVSVSLVAVQAQPQQGSCSVGQIAVPGTAEGGVPVTDCIANPCFGDNNPCLGGGTCTPIKINFQGNSYTYSTSCSCNAPYVATNIVTPILGAPGNFNLTRGFCVIPGADPCNPNPCFNSGICSTFTDGVSLPAFQCSCPTFRGISPQRCASPTSPSSTQGVCGTGDATAFPTRCYFNSDPQGRYVCCDQQGCNGFNADNLTPHCANNGFVPPGFGVSGSTPNPPPPPPPPSGSQGVCGTGDATAFPTRCYFNSDPQGRYVCCDQLGCNGFNADNLTPHCANNGFVPPGFGVSVSPPNPPPSPPSSGSQGVCGTGAATDFPTRCYFNNDPQGRYVCCDRDGCNGFAPPDNLFPRCTTNGYAPPGFGV